MNSDKSNLNRLTGLRFMAALYVFFYHVQGRMSLTFLWSPLQSFLNEGAIGVNVFFVLSGFILAYTYSEKLDARPNAAFYKTFILKRLSRIYPAYFVGLLACIVISIALHFYPQPFWAIVALNATLLHSYVPSLSIIWYGSGSWSISTEFFFYALFPVMLHIFLKIESRKSLLALLLAFIILSAIPGYIAALFPTIAPQSIIYQLKYAFPPLRLPEFASGMIASLLVFRFGWKVKPIFAIVAAAFCAVYLILCGWRMPGHVAHNLVIVPTVVLLLAALVTSGRNICFNWLGSPLMVYMGKVSYSFYIVQLPLIVYFDILLERGIVERNWYPTAIIGFAINLLGAILLYEFIEDPLHRYFNRRIEPKRRQRHEKGQAKSSPALINPS